MEAEKLQTIEKRMMYIIPGMICFMIGDYCMGIEPVDSYAISGMISSGWLTIANEELHSQISGVWQVRCFTQ